MTGYLRPTTAPITGGASGIGSFRGHETRKPPSQMPGVDYACGIGTPILAACDFVVTRVITSTASASGRQVYIRDLSILPGAEIAYIHLSSDIRVKAGDRGARGTVLARSGASANGKERGVDPHVHVSMWAGVAWISVFLDFEKYVTTGSGAGGGASPITPSTPTIEEIIMAQREFFFTLHRDNLYLCKLRESIMHLVPGDLDVGMGGLQTKGWWNLSDGKPLFNDIDSFNTKGGGTDWNDAAFANIQRLCTPPAVDVTGIAATVDTSLAEFTQSLQDLGLTKIDEAKIAEGLKDVLGESVAAALAKRLAG